MINSKKERRVGSPLTHLHHDRGIASEIGYAVDGQGNELPSKTKGQFARLRRWNGRAKFQTKKQQNLAHGLGEIRRVAAALGLPRSIQEQAAHLFRQASSAGILRGLSIESVAAACVYAVSRLNRLSRFLPEVAEVSRDSERRVRTAYQRLNADLNLPAPPPRPHEFVPRLATAVDVPQPVEQYALELLDAPGMDSFANGRNPRCVAAGCLYYAAREIQGYGEVTQGELAEAANVSPVSLRSVWQALSELEEANPEDEFPSPP